MPARSMADLTATAPNSEAERLARLPLKDPIGVLTADAITTSLRETFVEYAAIAFKSWFEKYHSLVLEEQIYQINSDLIRIGQSHNSPIPLVRQLV